MSTLLGTWTGRLVDVVAPRPEDIDVRDIAHALARLCRFGGHVDAAHFSVAQHSMVVSRLCTPAGPTIAFAGLLHDAAEAYLGDVVSPVRRAVGEAFDELERRWLGAIGERFGVTLDPLPPDVVAADRQALEWETACFTARPTPARGRALTPALVGLRADDAEALFLARFEALEAERARAAAAVPSLASGRDWP